MGMFRKVGAWLTEKSDRFIRGGADMPTGYYGSREAEQAYSGMGAEPREPEPDEDGEDSARHASPDPFGHGGGEYGGRVPYRSKIELEREARRQALEQQAVGVQGMQQPMQGQQMQQPMQGQQMQQPMQGQGNFSPKFCPECGAKNVGAKFCAECGNKF